MRRFGPLLLIALGVIFLLSNLGVVPIHEIRRFLATWWPLILIALGAAMLLDQRGRKS